MAGFEGSNPFRPIQPSVQIPKKIRKKSSKSVDVKSKNQHGIDNSILHKHNSEFKLRDLYNRKAKLEYWLQRASTDLQGTDKSDLLKLIEYMQDNERAILWIIRCISALLLIRKQLKKPFKDATKEDIRTIFKWMDDKKYKASTNEKFRQILKLFYKTVYGNSEYYPEQVKWFSAKVGKEKHASSATIDLAKYLEESEVLKLIEAATPIQKKTFLACMYECGARPEEFLRLTNSDLKIDCNGIVLVLRGKTGERTVRIIAYAKLLQQWLAIHPLKDQGSFPVWVSEATNYKNKPLGLRGAEKIIENLLPKVFPNKHATLYILRHSRATHLAKHISEAQMCNFFGWVQGTSVVRKYIHLSGKDLDSVLLSLNNSGTAGQIVNEYKVKTIKCVRCSEDIPPANTFCGRCGLSVSLQLQYLQENNFEEKNREVEWKIESMEQKMNQKLRQLMLMIQQNPKLALIKPEVILDKIK